MPSSGSSPAAPSYGVRAPKEKGEQDETVYSSFVKWCTCWEDRQKRVPDEETPLTENDFTPRITQSYGLQNMLSYQAAAAKIRADHASSLVSEFVESKAFEWSMLVFVGANALAIGFQIDHQYLMHPAYWLVLDSCFNAVYTLEILLRLHTYGCTRYFIVPYNLGCFTVTMMCWCALFTSLAAMETFQALQLFRMVRLAAVVPEILMLLESFVMSTKGLGWVAILGALMFFISSCVTTLFIGHFLSHDADPIRRGVAENFQTIPESMFTLFEIMTLEGWNSYVRPFVWSNPFLVVFLLAFIVVANLFVLNLVTAVVVDNTLRLHKRAHDLEEEQQRAARHSQVRRLILRMYELSEGVPVTSSEHVQAWVRSDELLQDCLQQLEWKPVFFLAVVDFCDDMDTGEMSLKRLGTALQDLQGQLTMRSFIHFQQQLEQRVEHIDHLCVLVMQSVAASVELQTTEELAATAWSDGSGPTFEQHPVQRKKEA